MSKKRKTIPDLRAEFDRIELDQVSLLITNIHYVFKNAYGHAPDVNEWNAVRIREEFEDLFTPVEFNRLFATEFGRGVIVGAWVERFIVGKDATEEKEDAN